MSTMNAWHPRASPRALFAAIGSFALGLFVATLSSAIADAIGDDDRL